MKNPDYYSIEDAVRDVLKAMPPGTMLLGYKLCNKVRSLLRSHGSPSVPLDSTILRRVREVKGQFGVEAGLGPGRSEYTKRDPSCFDFGR